MSIPRLIIGEGDRLDPVTASQDHGRPSYSTPTFLYSVMGLMLDKAIVELVLEILEDDSRCASLLLT
jgi:hypothetical protein